MRAIWRWSARRRRRPSPSSAAPRPRWRRCGAPRREAAHPAPAGARRGAAPAGGHGGEATRFGPAAHSELAGALRETLARREQAILSSTAAATPAPCSALLAARRSAAPTARSPWCCTARAASASAAISAGTRRAAPRMRRLRRHAADRLRRRNGKSRGAAGIRGAPGRVGRLDRDAAGGPGQAAALLARFARRELDVLVGTQMVAKGHDFPGVTLVGVLDADGPLHLPDFRAAERCVQLLIQVAGRAGRGDSPGASWSRPSSRTRSRSTTTRSLRPSCAAGRSCTFPLRPAGGRPPAGPFGSARPGRRGACGGAGRRFTSGGEPVEVLGPAQPRWPRCGQAPVATASARAGSRPLHRLARALQASHKVPGVQLALDVDPVALL